MHAIRAASTEQQSGIAPDVQTLGGSDFTAAEIWIGRLFPCHRPKAAAPREGSSESNPYACAHQLETEVPLSNANLADRGRSL